MNSLPSLPGECVEIDKVTLRVKDPLSQMEWIAETHQVPDLDLDGCASPVILTPMIQANPTLESFSWRLFIMRGNCGHELGLISGLEDPIQMEERHFGLNSFYIVEPAAPDIAETLMQGVGSTIYHFDGTRYVAGRTKFT